MATSSTTGVSADIEVLQHWAAEGADPLTEIIDTFGRTHPDVRFENHSHHVSSLRLVVKSQVLREDPPDLWIEWPGQNIELAVQAGVIADITDVWERADLEAHFVDGAKEAARFDGRYRCVPTDMYRINNLFFNREYVQQAGVNFETVSNPAQFVNALETLDAALDVPAIIINGRDPFGPLQLWETFLIAHGGPDAYEEIIDGQPRRHQAAIESAVDSLDRTLQYAPGDVTFMSSSASDAAFVAGEAAVTHNGGWALGRMKDTSSFSYGHDWEYLPFPGTSEFYQMNMNAMVPAAQREHDETVLAFLEHLASVESLNHIADQVGGVPPRSDVSVDSLHPVTQEHHRALGTTSRQLPSMAHGLGVRPDVVIQLKDAIATFMRDRSVDATTGALVEALASDV